MGTAKVMEFDEDDVVGYLVDEDDVEIGIIVREGDQEREYLYADEGDVVEAGADEGDDEGDDDYDLGITREGVAHATSDLNAVVKEGAAVFGELKDACEDILGGLKRK